MRKAIAIIGMAWLMQFTCEAHGSEDSIQNYAWLGLPMASNQAGTFEEPLSKVIDAHRIARTGTRDAFLALFDWHGQSGNQENVENLFDFWKTSTRYAFTLAAECKVSGGPPARRAYLITAKSLDGIYAKQEPWTKPFVIFAQEKSGVWKLTTADLAPNVTKSLLQEVEDYRPTMFPSAEDIQQKSDEFDRRYIEMLEERNVPRPTMIAEKELQELSKRKLVVNSWEDWQRVYSACMLTNMSPFSCLEPVEMDFSTPYAAWRSRLHALATGQIPVLLEHADGGAQKIMRDDTWYSPANNGKNRFEFPALTRVVPLMSAETAVDGEDYVLFWSRSEDPDKGREGLVSFDIMVLRKQNQSYFFTYDMDDSDFVRPHDLARPDGSMRTILSFGLYPSWHEKWAKSKFPAEFYTMGE